MTRRAAATAGGLLLGLSAAIATPDPQTFENEYPLIVQAHGPRRFDTSNACLLMLDEPAGATTVSDTARTPAMVAEGWGTVPTVHHGTPQGVQFGIEGQGLMPGTFDRSAYFDGSGRITLEDPTNDLDFSALTRFSFGARLMTQQRSTPGEWSIISHMHDGADLTSRDDDRGWRLSLIQQADGTQRLRFEMLTTDVPNAHIWCEPDVTIEPDVPYTVGCTYGGWGNAGAMVVYVRGEGITTNSIIQFDDTGWENSSLDIRGGTLRIGGDNPQVDGFRGWLAGFYVEPRRLAVEDINQLHAAALAPLPTPTRSLNLGIIREALRHNCFARVVGDSTSAVNGVSIGNMIPRTLEIHQLIPRRNAHFKSTNDFYLPAPQYISLPTLFEIDTAPGGFWPLVPGRRGSYFFTLTHNATNAPENATVMQFSDFAADVATSATLPRAQARFIYPISDNPNVSAIEKLSLSNGVETATTLIYPRGTPATYATTDIVLNSYGTGNITARVVGTSENEAFMQFGMYGVWLMNADSVAHPQPGLWWAGSVSKNGATTIPHTSDVGYYTMEALQEFDTALTAGVAESFEEKILFVMLTINDMNGNVTPDVVRSNFQAIADRWRPLGYKVCFIQPWIVFLGGGTGNPQRIPVNTYQSYWNDSFLPMAGDDVAVVSLHQWLRGVPYQYLEGTDNPSWAVHANHASSAPGLLTTLARSLKTAPYCYADFNGVSGITVQDIFDYLSAWLSGDVQADINGMNGVTVQDIFDFLTAWLNGCEEF